MIFKNYCNHIISHLALVFYNYIILEFFISMFKVSVVIRNRNEERWIGHTIQSVLDFFDNPEIIVVDNNSNDNSIEIIRSYRHDPLLEEAKRNYGNIQIKRIDDYTPGSALNLGVSFAQNKIICILSAHTIIKKLDSGYILEKLKKYPCIFGKQIPIYRGKRITPRYIWSHFKENDIVDMYSQYENRHFLHNAFAIYKKEFLERFPFDKHIVGKEDRLYAANLIKNGYSYLYTPKMIAYHHYTEKGNTWKGVG